MMLLQHSSAKVVLEFTGENTLIQSKALILTILFDKIGLFSTLFQRPCAVFVAAPIAVFVSVSLIYPPGQSGWFFAPSFGVAAIF
jgi:hypothetical protein